VLGTGAVATQSNQLVIGSATTPLTGIIYGNLTTTDYVSASRYADSTVWSGNREIKTAHFDAEPYHYYLVDTTSNAVIATLPLNPRLGTVIHFSDRLLTLNSGWNINNLTLNRNGMMIQGLSEDLVCDRAGISFTLTYVSASVGWRVD
jgi:hypothetical protein